MCGGCRGLGDWVRPLFCDHGVWLGLFTALSKQATVMGVALPCLLCGASCPARYKQTEVEGWSTAAGAYSCPTCRKTQEQRSASKATEP